MKKFNPASKTYFEFTKDRIQHYSYSKYICGDCNHEYYPKVHSQTYKAQFGAIIGGLIFYALVIAFIPKAFPIVAATTICYVIYYAHFRTKNRRISSSKLKYGAIVLECPNCGSQKGKLKTI
jgi:hypothetical protein